MSIERSAKALSQAHQDRASMPRTTTSLEDRMRASVHIDNLRENLRDELLAALQFPTKNRQELDETLDWLAQHILSRGA